MIKPTKLEITIAEAPNALSGTVLTIEQGDNWDAYNDALTAVALLVDSPKFSGYSKTDFVLYFEDGETYEGRADLKHPARADEIDGDRNLSAHINDAINGVINSTSNWITEENKEECRAFAAKYDLGPCKEVPA